MLSLSLSLTYVLILYFLINSHLSVSHLKFRKIEGNPIPETPTGEVIRLQTFPKRRGADSTSHNSLESVSDRRPDGAEYPELSYADRQNSRSSMPKSMETLLSSHSKLQQIPEKEPLLNQGNNYPQSESGMSEASSRVEVTSVI